MFRSKEKLSDTSDGELHSEVHLYEAIATWGGVAVAVAVILEVPLILWPLENDWQQKLCEAAATATIGLGVAAEVLFGKMAARRQDVLLERSNARLAVALERTEYRTLKDGKLLSALEKHAPASLVLKFLNDDPEIHAFAMDFELVFSARGWRVSWYTESYGDELLPGLLLPDRNAEDAPAITAVREALTEAGIKWSDGWMPSAFQSTGPFGKAPDGPMAILYIGPKPPVSVA
jgi:hypothetical protein